MTKLKITGWWKERKHNEGMKVSHKKGQRSKSNLEGKDDWIVNGRKDMRKRLKKDTREGGHTHKRKNKNKKLRKGKGQNKKKKRREGKRTRVGKKEKRGGKGKRIQRLDRRNKKKIWHISILILSFSIHLYLENAGTLSYNHHQNQLPINSPKAAALSQ